jgi:hypothetical protein
LKMSGGDVRREKSWVDVSRNKPDRGFMRGAS